NGLVTLFLSRENKFIVYDLATNETLRQISLNEKIGNINDESSPSFIRVFSGKMYIGFVKPTDDQQEKSYSYSIYQLDSNLNVSEVRMVDSAEFQKFNNMHK